MDIKHLQSFITVAEELNFTVAAKRLYLSQPSLSRRIHELENILGLQLFERDNKAVNLTLNGTYLLPIAKQLISVGNNITNTAKSLKKGMLGSIRIGYQASAKYVIPKYLRNFNKKYPNILISIEELGAESLLQSILEGNFDIIIVFSIIVKEDIHEKNLASKLITDNYVSLFMSVEKAAIYKDMDICTLKSFSNESFIQIDRNINRGYFEALHNLYLKNNFYPKNIIETFSFDTLVLLLESSMGISVLPKKSISKYYKKITSIDNICFDMNFQISAFWRVDNQNPCLSLFLEEL